jgi:hypothetical protein
LLKRIMQACEIDGIAYAEGQNVLFPDDVIEQLGDLVGAPDDSVGVYVSHEDNLAVRG